MADRADRFRRLRPRGESGKPESTTGDLFEHFGVEVGPAAPKQAEVAVEAAACRRCGWFLAYRRADPSCPMCGEPDPVSRVEGAKR